MRMSISRYPFSWARVVSDILSPPVVWAALVFPITFSEAESTEQAVTWALVYVVLVCVLPIVYIALMVQRGKITDIHMRLRHQRLRPLIVSVACTSLAWWALRLLGAPSVVQQFGLFSLIQIGLMMLITLVWQISIHAISISGATIATGVIFGLVPALLTLPLIVLVGAARLKLKRHTLSQVIAGTLIGAVVPIILFTSFAIS